MGGSDGSIIIDTELDQTGFEKGSDELLSRVKNLTQAIDTLGDNMMASFQSIAPILQRIADNTSNIYAAMSNQGQQAVETNDAVTEAVQRHVNATEAAQVSLQGLQTGITSVDREVVSLSGDLAKMENSMQNGFSNAGAVLRFKDQIDAAEAKVESLKARIAELASQRIPTEDYTFLSKAINDVSNRLVDLQSRQEKMREMGVKENSKQWRSLAYDIEQAKEQLATYRMEMAALEASGGAFINGSDTEQYKALNTFLQQSSEQLDHNKALIDAEAISQAQLNVQAAREVVIRAKTAAEREAAMEQLRAAQEELNALAKKSSGGGPNPKDTGHWSLLKGILGGVKSALVAVGSAAVGTARNLAKMGVDAIGKQFKSFTNRLKEFVSKSKTAYVSAGSLVKALTSVKTMLISRVKRMFISYLMNEVKSAMSALVQYSSEFDSAISGMRNATTELAGNMAVAFSNLVNAVAPAITTIINLVSQATSYLSAFFAMLGGKSTVTVAKKQTDSYADSLSGATKATKELDKANKTLGIDELNVFSNDSDSGGGGAGDVSDMYEDVSIDSLLPEDVSNWFDRIKAAFAEGDWYGIGYIIAEGLNSALGVVDDWINNTFRPLAVMWAARIAELLNGLVDGLDWTLLGKTFADGLNAVFDTANTFLTTLNFKNLGVGIGKALNGLFGNLEWALIGATFANKWNALIDLIYGVVTIVDWSGMGSSIAEFIGSWFNTIDWNTLALTVSTGWNGIVAALHSFITETDWPGMAATLAKSINTLASTIDWAEMGKTLSDGIISAFKFLTKAIQEIDWYGLGQDVQTFLVNIDWAGICSAMFEAIGSALGGLAMFIWGVIEGAWNNVVDWWTAKMEENGGDVIGGLLDGIGQAISDIGTWIQTNIFDPFIAGFKSVFGIHSPSTVMAEQGGFLIEGLLNGISKAWKSITQFFGGALEGLTKTLGNAWNTIHDAAGVAWDNLKTTANTKWTAITSTVSTLWNNLKTDVDALDWTSVGSNLVSGVKKGISNAWGAFKSWVTGIFSSVIDSVKGVFGISSPSKVFAEIGEYLDEGLIVGLKSGETGLLSSVKNLAGSVTDTMNDVSPELNISGTAMVNGLSNVADTLSGIAQTFSAIADTLTAMGGLQVPSIAAGTVVPYQTRVASSGNGAGDADSIGAAGVAGNAELISVLYEMMERIEQAIAQNGGDFYIGDDQIVRSYNRGNRARGIQVSRGAFSDAY